MVFDDLGSGFSVGGTPFRKGYWFISPNRVLSSPLDLSEDFFFELGRLLGFKDCVALPQHVQLLFADGELAPELLHLLFTILDFCLHL